MNKYLGGIAVLSLSLSLFACAPPHNPVDDILATPPAGMYDGVAWNFVKATVTRNTDRLDLHLFAEDVTDCASFAPTGSTTPYMMWGMPAATGSRKLQLDLFDLGSPDNQTVTMVTPPSSNNISTDGILNITDLTDTSITIGLDIRWGDTDEVNGTITATICP